MATNIIEGLRTREEYLETVQLSYYPVSMAIRNKEKHDVAGAETIQFRQLDVEKESIVAEALTPGQTEVAHIKAKEGTKSFIKVLKGAKIIQSVRNFGFNKIPELISKIVRGYSIIYDKQVLYGANGNNGVITTSDPNAINNASVQIDASGSEQATLNNVIKVLGSLKRSVSDYTASNDVLVYVYGSSLIRLLDTTTYNGKTVRAAIEEAWPEATFVEVPGLVTVGSGNGFSVLSQDLVTLNYTSMPNLSDDGYNREDKYFWADFELGSTMVDVKEFGALINQPVTIKTA